MILLYNRLELKIPSDITGATVMALGSSTPELVTLMIGFNFASLENGNSLIEIIYSNSLFAGLQE